MDHLVSTRLVRRARGRDWPASGVRGAFGATRADTAPMAHVWTVMHILIEVMELPGSFGFLARHSHVWLVGFSDVEYVSVPLPDERLVSGKGRKAGRYNGQVVDIQFGRRGLLSGWISLAGERFYVPRRQHRDLETFLSGSDPT